jgi:diaminopimelate decarboxylase
MLTRDAQGAVLGGISLVDLLRDGSLSIPTPAYVYDLDAMEAEARALAEGFGDRPHLVAYAVKANSAGPVVRALARGGAGADVVSGAELAVVLGCGIRPDRVLYSGVGKLARELDAAIGAGDRGIHAIQVESVEEIARIAVRAKATGRRARVSIRVNPGIEADTHAHVATGHDEAKFGVALADLPAAWDALARAPELDLVGLSSHVGSQLTRTDEYLAAAEVLLALAVARTASGARLEFIDFGGGFGIDYGAGCGAKPADFARAAVKLLGASPLASLQIVVEPGRSLVAAHGALCATVISAKRSIEGDRRWLIIDAGMNDLIRPALYAARHRIEPLDGAHAPPATAPGYRVVGPVCESSDDFGEHPFDTVPERVVIRDAGAYGFTMASEYNGRALPTEVFLRGGRVDSVSASPGVDAWVARRLGTA